MADVEVELWRVPTPIPHPVLTAAGPYDVYFHLVVIARRDGHVGWGYSGMATEGYLDDACRFAASFLTDRRAALATLLSAEQRGFDTASRGATSAIALAGWDLAARSLDVAVADLWGRPPTLDALPAYASGFFLDATIEQLQEEAVRYRRAGFRLVKMRTGLSLDDDVARYRAIKDEFPEPRAIAVDSFHSWRAPGARSFIDAVGADLLWVEDATPYDEMSSLQPSDAPIASGESLETTQELVDLVRTARLDNALLDVQRLGGPRNWLAAAQALRPTGARIGAHVYTPYSLHLLACVDDPLPVEVFDWSDPLLVHVPRPDAEGRLTIEGPGFGVDLDDAILQPYGRRI
jgi:L-alanine-DL-glutamate epimerase-like enolase superfamily enzyme